jgi:hypothetical protein
MDDAKQARITADMKREWSDAGAEIEALRASVARLTAERDAARSAIRAALDGADIAADGDGAWLDQSIVDRLRLGLECRPEAGELPDDGE